MKKYILITIIFIISSFFSNYLQSAEKKNEVSLGYYSGRISGIATGTGPYFSYARTLSYNFHTGLQLWYKNEYSDKNSSGERIDDNEMNLSGFIDWYYFIRLGVGVSKNYDNYITYFPVELNVPGFFVYKDYVKLNLLGLGFSFVHKRQHHDENKRDLYVDGGWFRIIKIDYFF